MSRRKLLKDGDIDPLADAVCRVLEKVGIYCQSEELLKALQESGASVDRDAQVATFPMRMTETFVEQLQAEAAQVAEPEPDLAAPALPAVGTQVAPFYHDYRTKECRSSNRADFIETVKLGDMLAATGHALALTDVPPMIEPLEAAMILAQYAREPGPAFAWNVRQADYLVEMGEILGKKDWFTWGAICFAHPLRFDKDVADRFVRCVRSGAATGLTAMPVAGLTTPVSVAGFIAVAGAEMLATWMAARAMCPGAKLAGSIWGGSVDMRSGAVSYCAFDAMAYSFALAEFLKRWCGQDVPVGGAEYCDAKQPGHYAALEKAHKAMMIAAFTGRSCGPGQGMLDEGRIFCPVQLLLERELAGGAQILNRTVEVTHDTLSLETIFEVGHGLTRNFLDTDNTLHNFRASLWCPELLDRSGWRGAQDDAATLQRIQGRIDDLLAAYKKPEVDQDKLENMRAVIRRARGELLHDES